jgi:hypothetical protein
MSKLKAYLDASGRLPEDALLGYVALTLGADAEHDRARLVEEFEARRLDVSQIPPVSRSVDAFKKALRNHDEWKYQIAADVEARVQFREVAAPNPSEVSLRVIMRELRVDSRSALGWEYAGEVRLYRAPRRGGIVDESGARFQFAPSDAKLQPGEMEHLRRLGASVRRDYDRYLNSLEGTRIRAMILSYLRVRLQSVPLKSSVHFVPIAHADELRRFAEAVGTLKGCKVDLIPLVDLADQREHILAAFQDDNDAALSELVVDLQKARTTAITPKTYKALRDRYSAIMERTAHYSELLDESLDRTAGASDVAKKSLAALAREFAAGKEI